jgi:hypothetical protein
MQILYRAWLVERKSRYQPKFFVTVVSAQCGYIINFRIGLRFIEYLFICEIFKGNSSTKSLAKFNEQNEAYKNRRYLTKSMKLIVLYTRVRQVSSAAVLPLPLAIHAPCHPF